MINLATKLAQTAWDLGPTSKSAIPDTILEELINDFICQYEGTALVTIETIPELNTFTVVIKAKETIELYSRWMETFEIHGYEAPFLVIDNGQYGKVT